MLNDAYNPIYNKIETSTKGNLRAKAMVIVDHQYLLPFVKTLTDDGFFNKVLNIQDPDIIGGVSEEILAWAISMFSISGVTDEILNEATTAEGITPAIVNDINYIIEYVSTRYRVPVSPAEEWSTDAKKIFGNMLRLMYYHWSERMARLLPHAKDITSYTESEVETLQLDGNAYWFSYVDIDLFGNKVYGYYLLS